MFREMENQLSDVLEEDDLHEKTAGGSSNWFLFTKMINTMFETLQSQSQSQKYSFILDT